MAFDLGAMLRRKGEFETARLDDFEFRQRARTIRLFAERRGLDPAPLLQQTALGDDEKLLAFLTEGLAPNDAEAVVRDWFAARADAHKQLVEEYGDPTPIRMA